MRIPNFCGPDHTGQSSIADVQRTMNWIPEFAEVPGGKGGVRLYPSPGVVNPPFAEFAEAPGRGIFEDRGKAFTVIGQTFYELDSAQTKTSRGTVATNSNPATMASNGDGGDEVQITSGGKLYMWDVAGSAFTTEVTSGVTMGDHLDGYFFYLDADTSKLSISDLFDGTTWDPTQFLQRSDAADPWKAAIQQGGEIWAIGGKTGGVLYNAGTSPYPFAPRTESFFERGIAAPFTLARFAGTVMWLGASESGHGIVYMAMGYTPTRVSDYAMEAQIQNYSTISDAIGWTYEDRGHKFYVLEFPTADATWVYDRSSLDLPGLWHRRSKFDERTSVHKAYRPRFHALAFGKHLVCDGVKGAVYEMSVKEGRDVDAAPIRRERRAPHISNENKQIIVDEFQVELERGIGSADSNLLNVNDALALGAAGSWVIGSGASSVERVIIADEGIVSTDLPTGIKTAYKVTLNAASSVLVALPVALTAALHDIEAYVLAGGTWAGRPNLLAESGEFTGSSTGTATAVTPTTTAWQRTNEPVTPVSTDLTGNFRINGNGAGSFTSGDVFYFTNARIELDGGQLPEPMVMFRYSKDGGKTWSNERTVSAGKQGDYRARAIFRRLGLGRDWGFEIAVSQDSPYRIIDGFMEARPGAH